MKVSCQPIADFYKIHQEKGKAYTYNNFKTSGYSKAGIYKIMFKFDEMGIVDHKIFFLYFWFQFYRPFQWYIVCSFTLSSF